MKLGEIPSHELFLYQGSEFAMELALFNDDEETEPLPIVGVYGAVKRSKLDDDDLVSWGTFASFDDGVATVVVPASTTIDIEEFTGGAWDLGVVLDTGEERVIARGPAGCERKVFT